MKRVIIGLACFVSGSLVGIFASKAYYKNKYEKIANEEILEIQNAYAKREKRQKEDSEQVEEPEAITPREMAYISKYKAMEMELAEREAPKDDDDAPTHLISVLEYSTNDEYEKQDLVFYEEDSALVNSDYDGTLIDIDKIIGKYALSHFGDNSYRDDTVYVRDEKNRIDYQIVRVPGSYALEVLGIDYD